MKHLVARVLKRILCLVAGKLQIYPFDKTLLRVLENRVLRKVSGIKSEKIAGR
jgi:hypothetical protein